MDVQNQTLPTRKVLAELIRKFDAVEPYDSDDLHWMVNVLHALNEDADYQRYQERLEEGSELPVVAEFHAEPKREDESPPTS